MNNLNENLGAFLRECNNDASSSLYSDERYVEWKNKRDGLLLELESLISPEAAELLTRYTEALTVINGMDSNITLICGLTLMGEVRRIFDVSTPEYKEFTKAFVF